MEFFDEHPGYPLRELSPDQVAYLRRVLEVHTNHASTGLCPICGVPRCPDWRDAFDHLAVAGQLMADPDRWRPADSGGQ